MKLPALQTDSGMYSLLGLDETENLAALFGLDVAETSSLTQIHGLQLFISEVVSEYVSGIVLDPRSLLDLPIIGNHRPGIIYRLAQQPYQLIDAPKLIANWGVESTRNNYGVAKLTFSYNPSETNSLEKKKFLIETYDFCHFEGIDLILDLKIISSDGSKIHPDNLAETQLQAVQELRNFADLFALEYPGDALKAATITAELDRDWIVSSADQSYAVFKENLRNSLDSGAKGFLASSSLWQEMSKLRHEDMSPDFDQIPDFVQNSLRDRMIELSRILDETAKKEE